MPAAVPEYLKEFSEAPPGHRFSLYYAGWNDDWTKPKGGVVPMLDAIKKLLWKMADFLVARVADREDERAHAHALKLQHLAHAEGLREGGEALENIGEVVHRKMVDSGWQTTQLKRPSCIHTPALCQLHELNRLSALKPSRALSRIPCLDR